MKNGTGNGEDIYGNITFGEITRLLVDIIGQNAILDLMHESERGAYKRNLERMYNGQGVYRKFSTAEPESLQWYFAQFFEGDQGIEKKYDVLHTAMIVVDSFIWQFFYALRETAPFEKLKQETALFLMRKELFTLIDNLIRGIHDKEQGFIKISKKNCIDLITDSYKKIFSSAMESYKTHEDFFKCLPEKERGEHRQNISNWLNGGVYNPSWKELISILDFFYKKKKRNIVHRLI